MYMFKHVIPKRCVQGVPSPPYAFSGGGGPGAAVSGAMAKVWGKAGHHLVGRKLCTR